MTAAPATIEERRLQWQQLTPDQRRVRVHRCVADCIEIYRWRRAMRLRNQSKRRGANNDHLFAS